jgi:hypothetical protein
MSFEASPYRHDRDQDRSKRSDQWLEDPRVRSHVGPLHRVGRPEHGEETRRQEHADDRDDRDRAQPAFRDDDEPRDEQRPHEVELLLDREDHVCSTGEGTPVFAK